MKPRKRRSCRGNRGAWSLLLAGVALLTACAQPRAVREWTSIPLARTEETPACDVRLEPIKKGRQFFAVFRLTVRNKSPRTLILDWNRTRYLHNGLENGPFAFAGIDPATIRDASIPAESISPGSTLDKEIFPANLIAYTPMREELLNGKGRGLFPGPLPEGNNGIRLIIQENGHSMVQDVVVEIR